MLSINTLPTTIAQFANDFSISKIDFKRLTRPGFHRDAALHSAYAKFADGYGNWVDSHFDEHFLAHSGAVILADFASSKLSRHEAAVQLAIAWDVQMGPVRSAVRQRRIADATMAADRFLGWYATA